MHTFPKTVQESMSTPKGKINVHDVSEERMQRALDLVYAMLPDEMADEILEGKKPKARHYSNVSILFTDIKNFTKIAEDYRPQELVEILNRYFTKFDSIASQYGVERVKTIGDSFMGVAGCPQRKKEHAVMAALAAREIQQWLHGKKERYKAAGEDYIEIKVGIHSGEVVAGIIGKFRYAFDVWGDSVNLAFRMQENCEPGKINVSEATYYKIRPFFDMKPRGPVKTKHKGLVDMYYVSDIKQGLHHEGKPNEKFWEMVDLLYYGKLDYLGLERDLLKFLKQRLPKDLHYHGIHHTEYVTQTAERIALAEGIRGEALLIIKTAALFHDAGFVEQYNHNESTGATMAKTWLPKYGYTPEQVAQVCDLVMATRVPQEPKNQLQRIICDADLFYLGSPNFHAVADTLFQELKDRQVVQNKRDWDAVQIKFLTQHTYHTDFANKKAQPGKLRHLEEIKERYQQDRYPANTPL